MEAVMTEYQFDSDLTEFEYAKLGMIRDGLGRKFEVEDLFTHDEREFMIDCSIKYAETYRGTFDFMQDMALQYKRRGLLSERMHKGILNCLAAEYRRWQSVLEDQARERERQLIQPDHAPIETGFTLPNGTYTLVTVDGYRTFKIKDIDVTRYEKPVGTRMIAFMNGPDNETSYQGFGWIFPDGKLAIWGRFRDDSELARDAETFLRLDEDGARNGMEAYALVSGRCAICGRKLTVPASIHRGIGPDCASQMAW